MPKTLFMPKECAYNSGLDVTWTRSRQQLSFSGWYDGCVGIQGDAMTLREFFDALGITEADCRKAWRARTS